MIYNWSRYFLVILIFWFFVGGTETINQLLSSNEVFTSNFDDFGTDSGLKVPYSVENIVTYISLITGNG